MAALFEDTVGGSADISGDPPPVSARTPEQVRGEQRQGVNQKSVGQKQQKPPPVPTDQGAPATSASQTATDQGSDTNPTQEPDTLGGGTSPNLNVFPHLNIDWGKQFQQDASSVYQTGRRVVNALNAFLDPNAIHQSVQNIWEQDTAQAKMARLLMSGGASAIPGLNQQRMGEAYASGASEALPVAANPINVAAGEGVAGIAAASALGGAYSALSDPNQAGTALAWSALTGMLLGGTHLPPEARAAVAKTFGKWPQFESFVGQMLRVQRDANRKMVAGGEPTDWIDATLKEGGYPGSVRTPRGRESPAEGGKEFAAKQKTLKTVYKAAGVSGWPELVQKASTTGITGEAAKLISKHWKELGQPYELKSVTRADDPLRDPRPVSERMTEAGGDAGQAAQSHMSALSHYLDQIHRGHFANAEDPMHSVWRSLVGISRTTDLVHQSYMKSALDLVPHSGMSVAELGDKLTRAVEGDKAVYDALPDAGKLIVDSSRLITNALRLESRGSGYAENFVGNWFPRLDRAVGDKRRITGGASVLAREARKHRTTAIMADAGGRLVETQKYGTVHEANDAIAQQRSALVDALTNPLSKLPKEFKDDPYAQNIREMAGSGLMEQALSGAKELATRQLPEKETNWFMAMNRALGRQTSAVHTFKALTDFTKMRNKEGLPLAQAVTDSRTRQRLAGQGYKAVEHGLFQNYMFHGDLADLLDRSIRHARPWQDSSIPAKAFGKFLDLEGKAIGRIMYFPPVHAMNIANRASILAGMDPATAVRGLGRALSNPAAFLHYLRDGTMLAPHLTEDESFRLRQEAYNSGVLPHSRNLNYMQQLNSAMGGALGDHLGQELEDAALTDQGARGLKEQWTSFKQNMNNYFWGRVNDFGVLAYHLEHDAAVRAGVDEVNAKLHAARRANTWMGHVAPEDTNPFFHDLARGVAFAPNWWRTWGELMVPYYNRSGVTMTPELARHVASQQAKLIASMFVFQKVTGNLLNLIGSGHLQNQNLPGNQDRVELSNFFPNDPNTGGRMTVENPLGRFQRDLEMMAGLQSGYTDWKPQDALEGIAKFAISRLSPEMEAAGAMVNFDPYRAVTSGFQNNRVTQNGWTAMDAFYGIMYATGLPGAFDFVNQMESAKPDQSPIEPPVGPAITGSTAQAVHATKDTALKTALGWFLGVNAPYKYAQRSRGTTPSDAQYNAYDAERNTYNTQMQTLSAQALGGQKTPAQWLAAYRNAHSTYSTIAESTFRNAPHYVNGAEGLAAEYEGLYDQATDPSTGEVDYGKLDQLQAQWRQAKGQQGVDLTAMDEYLKQSDQKYPMLGLYHKTLDAYGKWQGDWAAKNGIDISTLRQDVSQYGQLYGDRRASVEFLQTHRDVQMYEQAKKREWYTSPAGLMYGLFYQSPEVMAYLGARHIAPEQVIQQEEQQP